MDPFGRVSGRVIRSEAFLHFTHRPSWEHFLLRHLEGDTSGKGRKAQKKGTHMWHCMHTLHRSTHSFPTSFPELSTTFPGFGSSRQHYMWALHTKGKAVSAMQDAEQPSSSFLDKLSWKYSQVCKSTANSFLWGLVLFRHSPAQRQGKAWAPPGSSPSIHPQLSSCWPKAWQKLWQQPREGVSRGEKVSNNSRTAILCAAGTMQTSHYQLEDLSDLVITP